MDHTVFHKWLIKHTTLDESVEQRKRWREEGKRKQAQDHLDEESTCQSVTVRWVYSIPSIKWVKFGPPD